MRISRFWSGAETLLFLAFASLFVGAQLLISATPMRAGVPKPVVIGAVAAPTVQATIYLATFHCPPCDRYATEVKAELPPDGWIVCEPGDKQAETAHVIITKRVNPADKINAYPTTIIRRNGVEVDRLVGRQSPTVLCNAINAVRGKP